VISRTAIWTWRSLSARRIILTFAKPARGSVCAADCRGRIYRTRQGRRQRQNDALRTMCLVPRGTEEGSTIEIDPGNLQLVTNKPVSFRLYSSRARTEDKAGEVVGFAREDEDLHLHAPLNALLRFGKAGERLVPVKLGARLTEVGTLDIWRIRKRPSIAGDCNSSCARRRLTAREEVRLRARGLWR